MKNSRKSDPPPFIYNLISRTLMDFTKKSASYADSQLRIRPSTTPDMLPNTFRDWEISKRSVEKQFRGRQYCDTNNYNINQSSGLFSSASSFSDGPHSIDSNSITSGKVKPTIGRESVSFSQNNGRDDDDNKNRRPNFLNNNQMRSSTYDSSHNSIESSEKKQIMRPNPAKYTDSVATRFKSNEKKLLEEMITETTTNVTVHIGRIHVRAQLPKGSPYLDDSNISSPSSSSPSHYSRSHLSLNDYLRQRSEGRF